MGRCVSQSNKVFGGNIMNIIFIPTRSGIMVDGSDAGSGIEDGNQGIAQDFRDADMLVVGTNMIDHKGPKDEPTRYATWAIYGNKLIESCMHIAGLRHLNENEKVKVILARKKPYILPGDWCG